MPHQEIERKFLVHAERLPALPPGERLVQGYLATRPTVRVRTHEGPEGERSAFLTIKGDGLLARDEFEYAIPFEDAVALFKLCKSALVSKMRHRLCLAEDASLAWEVDVFDGDNAGLIVAEIELPSEEHPFERPEWIGEDVTFDPAYKNADLASNPYRHWNR
jgi:adenylate cyclase